MSNIDNMYRDLSDEAKARFRQWARDNYQEGQDILSNWHPIIKDECRIMDECRPIPWWPKKGKDKS